MDKFTYPAKIGNDVEIESLADNGTYVIIYPTDKGYKQLAWHPNDPIPNNLDSYVKAAIQQVKKHLGIS
jgi:fructose-bisphosphate aldolase class 1